MVGQESSAKAPEKLSNSNSFLHKKKIPALRHSYNLEAERKHKIFANTTTKPHTCRREQELPTLHREKQYNMALK
jgi:hypothetical protein